MKTIVVLVILGSLVTILERLDELNPKNSIVVNSLNTVDSAEACIIALV